MRKQAPPAAAYPTGGRGVLSPFFPGHGSCDRRLRGANAGAAAMADDWRAWPGVGVARPPKRFGSCLWYARSPSPLTPPPPFPPPSRRSIRGACVRAAKHVRRPPPGRRPPALLWRPTPRRLPAGRLPPGLSLCRRRPRWVPTRGLPPGTDRVSCALPRELWAPLAPSPPPVLPHPPAVATVAPLEAPSCCACRPRWGCLPARARRANSPVFCLPHRRAPPHSCGQSRPALPRSVMLTRSFALMCDPLEHTAAQRTRILAARNEYRIIGSGGAKEWQEGGVSEGGTRMRRAQRIGDWLHAGGYVGACNARLKGCTGL